MTSKDGLKALVQVEVDREGQELVDLSLRIHAHPEIAFQEELASRWLCDYLEGKGFAVEHGTTKLPTAFRAQYGAGQPAIAFLAEYDALPGIGHGCGHNIIAASAIGGAVACRPLVDELGGSIIVLGTPAEEGGGGKILMAQRGAFQGLDVAMLVHPSGANRASMQTLARVILEVEFYGKAAHASARPQEGVNALDALLYSINAVNALRHHIRPNSRIHGIITKGGDAPNIVPDYTSALFYVRARTNVLLEALKERVLSCFRAGALATGARLEYQWREENRYAPVMPNRALARLFGQNLQRLGRTLTIGIGENGFGSTDLGNVSLLLPTIQPTIAIANREMPSHSLDFARAAASEAGHQGLLDAAKALAMTAADLIADQSLIQQAWDEFHRSLAEARA